MDHAILRRAVSASVASALVPGALAAVLTAVTVDPVLALPVLGGAVLLGAAQILRAAATLRRAKQFNGIDLRIMGTTVLSVALTSLAVSLLAAGLGGDGDCHILGCVVGATAWLRLAGGRALDWSSCPREAVHRRLKGRLFGNLCSALHSAALCVLVSALVDGSSVLHGLFGTRLVAGVLALLATEAQAEALESCTSPAVGGAAPTGAELAAALTQPLGVSGRSLGRWGALTALAQAVAHRQCGAFPGVRAGTGVGVGADAGSAAYTLPALAAEVFGRRGGAGRGLKADSHGFGGSGPLLGGPPPSAAAGRGTLFGTYLASGLEVIREFTVRVQCLVGAARRKGALALLPAQLAALDAQVLEVLPLMKVSAAGLTGWLCLSRDVDEAGVVQREQALQRTLIELCGAFCAIRELSLLRGALEMSAESLPSAQEEVRHSLEQLLLAFRDAGLQQVRLPPAYKHLVAELCR